MSQIERLNLTLRVVMEVGVVVALVYWGLHTGETTVAKVLLGVGAPAATFGFWGGARQRKVSVKRSLG